MNEIIKFLSSNSNWIKDISTVFFTATGTVIAILSYRRAKSSIFQPKRNEVTKVQTEILVDFLKSFIQNGNSIDKAIDYPTLFRHNIDLALRDFDLSEKIETDSDRYKEINSKLAGWYEKFENGANELVFFEGNLEDYDLAVYSKNQHNFIDKNKRSLKQRNPQLKRIFVSKKHKLFVNKLSDLSDNPFLSKELQKAANQIGNNLVRNVHFTLKKVIEELLLEVYEAYVNQDSSHYEDIVLHYKYGRVWDKFEKEKVSHEQDYKLLNKKIRKHLMIDEKW